MKVTQYRDAKVFIRHDGGFVAFDVHAQDEGDAQDQARLRDLPVIMISALTELNSMARCIELGAVDPTAQELAGLIELYIFGRRAAR